MAFGSLFVFADVFRSEIRSINKRRARFGRPEIALEDEKAPDGTPLEMSDGTVPLRPKDDSEVVGLALSGGGIRSAAFCLGALQALREADVLNKVDYLSTVSGGGYIGSSLTSGMTATGGRFPFKSGLSEDETPSTQHVRDHSNFLFPHGAGDYLCNASIYVRGLVANAVLILPFLLVAAALTIFSVPVIGERAETNILGFKIYNMFSFNDFVLSAYVGLFLLLLVILWGIWRSVRPSEHEVTGRSTRIVSIVVLFFLITVFCELQPFLLNAMFRQGEEGMLPSLVSWMRSIVLWLSPFAAAIAFLADKLGDVAKSALESERGKYKAYIAKAVVYIAALVVPLFLWLLYLQFSYWGVCLTESCVTYNAPKWLVAVATIFPGGLTRSMFGVSTHIIAQLYIAVAIFCLVLVALLRPNANSLHPLYRARLSRAFLFQPEKVVLRSSDGIQPLLEPLTLKLSQLSDENSPYHLINTALNVQNSKYVNRRGRNADFFLFSRNFIGSMATDYVATSDMEEVMHGLTLGAAMSASGAAASSNMGSQTVKPLTPTLALLNIRLGFWMRNPRWVEKRGRWNRWANFYFVLEMLGLLNERRRSIYVTDGGHIENLGIYELLRRRCKVIVAVDAEADPQIAFGSFNTLERYALIDLGVRINLPWQQITNATRETAKAINETGDAPKREGPHVAIGEIIYPGERRGVLVYIKSSLTGDENDYIYDYRKRYPEFPHETTLDQFFSEEQFEAYRALGFHATFGFLECRDGFAHLDLEKNFCIADDLKLLDRLFPMKEKGEPFWSREHATFASRLPATRAV